MKKAFSIFALLYTIFAFAQTDKNGNPVFNSIVIAEEPLGQNTLVSNYYTLKFNIENKGSSVFISQKPTPDEIAKAATNLPSDFFFVVKDQQMGAMIMFNTYPRKMLMVISMSANESKEFPVKFDGDITENRANEIIKEKYDPKANIKDGVLYFNKKEYKIIPTKDIKKAVTDIIASEKLTDLPPSGMRYLSQSEIRQIMLDESKEGGDFDFFTQIKGKEYDAVQIKPQVFATNSDIALYKWGRTAYEMGVETLDDTYSIYAEVKGKPLNIKEKECIKAGFEKAWEN